MSEQPFSNVGYTDFITYVCLPGTSTPLRLGRKSPPPAFRPAAVYTQLLYESNLHAVLQGPDTFLYSLGDWTFSECRKLSLFHFCIFCAEPKVWYTTDSKSYQNKRTNMNGY